MLKAIYRYLFGHPALLPFGEHFPTVGAGCYLAPGCRIVGNVKLGDRNSVWFNAVVRGDGGPVTTGNRVNIQDSCVIHCLRGGKVVLGNDVSVGHSAIIHGAEIEDNVLVGVGAIVLDGALLKSGVVLGAGALVPPGKTLEAGLWLGAPAKRHDQSDSVSAMIGITSGRYLDLIDAYMKGCPVHTREGVNEELNWGDW